MSAVRSSLLLKEGSLKSQKMSLRPLSKELQEKASSELNENPNRIESDINYIKEWLDKQPHLKARKGELPSAFNLMRVPLNVFFKCLF